MKDFPPGKYLIEGTDAFATITEGLTKPKENMKWESHRKFIDLQYVISGEEQIGVLPVASSTVTDPYNAARDTANYTADGNYYIATPMMFFLFFSEDAHRPGIRVNSYEKVKKLVIKIPVS